MASRKASLRLPSGKKGSLVSLKKYGKVISSKELARILKKSAKRKHIYLGRNAPFKLRSVPSAS